MKSFLNNHPNLGMWLIAISALGMFIIFIMSMINTIPYKKNRQTIHGQIYKTAYYSSISKRSELDRYSWGISCKNRVYYGLANITI